MRLRRGTRKQLKRQLTYEDGRLRALSCFKIYMWIHAEMKQSRIRAEDLERSLVLQRMESQAVSKC